MNAKQQWTRNDWLIAILLFVASSSLYFATTSGITSSNDGSHYALIRTIVENRSFALEQFDDFAEGNDIAIADDGRLFSDRPPGVAMLGALFYSAGRLVPGSASALPARHDASNMRMILLMVLPAWAGAATVVLVYAMMRELALSRAAALTASLMFSLGTIHWKYSSVLYSHALSSFLVILSLFLTIRIGRRSGLHRANSLLLGIVLGYSVLVEYSNALLVPIVITYLFWQKRPFSFERSVTLFGPLILGGLLSAFFLAFYNNANFGSPFRLSYAFAINYPWASSFSTTFNYPLFAGLQALLFWGSGDGWCNGTCYNQGIFLISPLLLLAIPGCIPYWRKSKTEFLLTIGSFLIYLILFAKHRTSHGFTADGRYLVPFLGLLVIPIGFTFEWLFSLSRRPVWQALLLLISYGMFFVSVSNVFFHIGSSYNYHLDVSTLALMPANASKWQYLASQVFRNVTNLPYLWLLEAALFMILFFVWRVLLQKGNRQQKP